MTEQQHSLGAPPWGPQLWTRLDPALRTGDEANPELESILAEMWASARTAWPKLELAAADYFAEVARKVAPPGPLPAALRQLHAADLYLAAACRHGTPGAVEAFEATVVPDLTAALANARIPAAVADDARQKFLADLFVGDPPQIEKYGGRGRLQAWVRICLLRRAHNAQRSIRREEPGSDALFDRVIGTQDPELDVLKHNYRAEFRRAFEEAVQRLAPRERTLLRQYLIDGLTSHELGTLYRVHRATASRWVVAAQEQLVKLTRAAMMERLGVGGAEAQSIMRLIESRLEASVHRLLEQK